MTLRSGAAAVLAAALVTVGAPAGHAAWATTGCTLTMHTDPNPEAQPGTQLAYLSAVVAATESVWVQCVIKLDDASNDGTGLIVRNGTGPFAEVLAIYVSPGQQVYVCTRLPSHGVWFDHDGNPDNGDQCAPATAREPFGEPRQSEPAPAWTAPSGGTQFVATSCALASSGIVSGGMTFQTGLLHASFSRAAAGGGGAQSVSITCSVQVDPSPSAADAATAQAGMMGGEATLAAPIGFSAHEFDAIYVCTSVVVQESDGSVLRLEVDGDPWTDGVQCPMTTMFRPFVPYQVVGLLPTPLG